MTSPDDELVEVAGAAQGRYVIVERRADGELLIAPDQSFEPEISLDAIAYFRWADAQKKPT